MIIHEQDPNITYTIVDESGIELKHRTLDNIVHFLKTKQYDDASIEASVSILQRQKMLSAVNGIVVYLES